MVELEAWQAGALKDLLLTQVRAALDECVGKESTVRAVMEIRFLGEAVTRDEAALGVRAMRGRGRLNAGMVTFRERRGVRTLADWLWRVERTDGAWGPTALTMAWYAGMAVGAMSGAGSAPNLRTLRRRDPLAALAVTVLGVSFPWERYGAGHVDDLALESRL